MRCAALLSGGKDGWLAVWYGISNGLQIDLAVTFIPKKLDSFMFHGINSGLVKKQAKLAGMKHMEVKTSGEKREDDEELVKTFTKLRKLGFQAVISGAIESEYQRERIERACVESGLVHFAPLWHKNQKQLLDELLDSNHDAIIVSAAADGMGKEWLGRKISECKKELLELSAKRGISVIGEGGEFETFCFKSSLFKRELRVGRTRLSWKGSAGYLAIETVK